MKQIISLIAVCLMAAGGFASAGELACSGAARISKHASAFDSATGKDPRRYPPDPQVDFQHIKLDLRMPQPMSRSFDCTETINFKTLGRATDRLTLNAVELDIESITDLDGKPLDFRADDKRLLIRFGKELAPGTDAGVVIEYSCHQPKAGMIFALPNDAYPNRPLMIHTQGEAELNRFWFVCHDYPNERQTTEIIATVPSNLSVLSNGALAERADAGNGLTRWHYKLARPHVTYLVSLVIGQFEVVRDKWRDIPVEYWVAPDKKETVQRTFGKTPRMIELFSKLTGADYPYEKYAQSVVNEFSYGGMENTSCTTLTEVTGLDERAALDQDEEGLISHELAHQWFGDMLTCKTWAHLWLNEGFATYMEAAWYEAERGRKAYDYEMWETMRDVAATDTPDPKAGLTFAGSDDPDSDSQHSSDPYGKGASVLHMLRQSTGDDLFWRCMQEYVKRNAWRVVESDDLRKVFEELSGKSYERFFQQWVVRAGAPDMHIAYDWDDDSHEVKLDFEQKQTISADLPAFDVEIPIWLISPDGKITKDTAHISERTGHFELRCDAEPAQICIDPQGAVLMQLESDLPVKMLAAQAQSGPTPRARLDAIAALGTRDRPAAREALRSILLDEKQHYGFRKESAVALGKMQQPDARQILIDALAEGRAIKDHKSRRAAVEALGSYCSASVVPTLVRFAKSDPSYAVEAEATTALGKQNATDTIVEVLLANVAKPSYRDQIRLAAINALAGLNEPRGIEPAEAVARYGQPYRSRPRAIESLAKLARSQDQKTRDDACMFLVALIDDPQERSAVAAIRALGELGDTKAIDRLQKFVDSSALERLRTEARASIDKINKNGSEAASIKDLRQRIEALEKRSESATTRESK